MRSAASGKPKYGLISPIGRDAVGVAKMMRVPLDTLGIIGGEKIGLFDSGRQIDAALENFMQPRRTGAAGADADEVGQPQVARAIGRICH